MALPLFYGTGGEERKEGRRMATAAPQPTLTDSRNAVSEKILKFYFAITANCNYVINFAN